MDIMWIAIAVDLTIYCLIGLAIVTLGRRFLPEPWNQAAFTVPIVLVLGAMITMATYQHWLVYPR